MLARTGLCFGALLPMQQKRAARANVAKLLFLLGTFKRARDLFYMYRGNLGFGEVFVLSRNEKWKSYGDSKSGNKKKREQKKRGLSLLHGRLSPPKWDRLF